AALVLVSTALGANASSYGKHHYGYGLGYGLLHGLVGHYGHYGRGHYGRRHYGRHSSHGYRYGNRYSGRHDSHGSHCRKVTKIGDYEGYKSKIGGTLCEDDYGDTYIVPGSRYVIERY
ncbi:MAG: hypothetical protein ABFS23_11300, partial [Pseudomonadota bacterium]